MALLLQARLPAAADQANPEKKSSVARLVWF